MECNRASLVIIEQKWSAIDESSVSGGENPRLLKMGKRQRGLEELLTMLALIVLIHKTGKLNESFKIIRLDTLKWFMLVPVDLVSFFLITSMSLGFINENILGPTVQHQKFFG